MDALHALVQAGTAALALFRMEFPVDKRICMIALIEAVRPDHRAIGTDERLPGRLVKGAAPGAKAISS